MLLYESFLVNIRLSEEHKAIFRMLYLLSIIVSSLHFVLMELRDAHKVRICSNIRLSQNVWLYFVCDVMYIFDLIDVIDN